jgi:hypothetical protein
VIYNELNAYRERHVTIPFLPRDTTISSITIFGCLKTPRNTLSHIAMLHNTCPKALLVDSEKVLGPLHELSVFERD